MGLTLKQQKQRISTLKSYLGKAETYEQWKQIALELDDLERHNEWKEQAASELYNYDLLADRLNEFKRYKASNDLEGLARALREGLHHDLGNMGDIRLYSQAHFGTKRIIENYVDVVCDSIKLLARRKLSFMDDSQKLEFFKDILLSFGRPALLLSGGASLGMFHVGVVKALFERDLLPQVITGSSAGSIVAAALGTHTDDELPSLFAPDQFAHKTWRWQGLMAGFKGHGFMDPKQVQGYIRKFVGEYTMQEAYERTGRSINISVSPVQHHQKARLLCGYTSPYILMWSAALASSAVPAIFPPIKLMKKDAEGRQVPFMPKLRWVDGSVVSDLPVERLMHLYDVNYTIVSQTNPHVVPFLDKQAHRRSPSLLSWPSRWLKAEMKFHGMAITDFARKHADNELLRQVSGQIYSLFDQRYNGDITIAPNYRLEHYMKVISNPEPEFIRELMLQGERETWPKLSMIKTHAKISHTLEAVVDKQKAIVRKQNACKPKAA